MKKISDFCRMNIGHFDLGRNIGIRWWPQSSRIPQESTPSRILPQSVRSLKISTKSEKQYRAVKDMPGPRPVLPLIGTSWIYSSLGPYTKDGIVTYGREELLAKYGPIYKEHLGSTCIVNLHDPKHIENLMRRQGRIPMRVLNEANIYWRKKRPDLYRTVGLVDSTGEEWHDLRHKVAPSVLKPSAVSSFVESLSTVADSFVHTIREEKNQTTHEIPDVRGYLFRYGLEAIWNTTLGCELGALRTKQPDEAKELIILSVNLFHSFASLSLSRPWWKLWPTPTFKKFCKSEEAIFRIVSRYTQTIIKESRNRKEDTSTSDGSILKRFLSTKDFDIRDINTVIMDFIAAGIPTTSYFLSLLLLRLGQEKELQKRLQSELDTVVPDKTMTLSDSALKSVPLLNAIIQEGFRLTTIIPAIMRLLPEDIICDAYEIPAYTPILCQTRAASRSEKYFSLPKEFIPDRWLRNAADGPDSELAGLQKQAKSHHFAVLPFGFGPRMCVGKRLAEKEIAVLLAKIFLNFNIESEGEVELANYYIIGPKKAVSVKFIEK